MTKIHNFEKDFRRVVERIRDSEINENNKKALLDFKDFLLSEGIGYAKITRYLIELKRLESLLGKAFTEANEQDIRGVVSQINQMNYSENTKRDFRLVLRRFYCYLRGCKKRGQYPPEVEWISLAMSNSHRKLPEELLTEEEIKKIIQNCDNVRDRALISSLAETGARISEIGNMKIKHIAFEEYGARLSIEGKTGARKVLVIWSTPYLQEWVNQHPRNSNPDSYLWYNPKGELLCYQRIAAILKKSARRAGIVKRIYPHLFRHSQATQMANIMSEAAMKQYFGWMQSSKMAGIYVHMSGRDTDEAVLRANGIELEKEKKKNKIKPKICQRCKLSNEPTNKCCKSCGLILDEEYANEVLKKDYERNTADEIMNKLMQDPEVLELIKKKLQN